MTAYARRRNLLLASVRAVMVVMVMVHMNLGHLVLRAVATVTLVRPGLAALVPGLPVLGLRLVVLVLASVMLRCVCHRLLASMQGFHLAEKAHLGSLVSVLVAGPDG